MQLLCFFSISLRSNSISFAFSCVFLCLPMTRVTSGMVSNHGGAFGMLYWAMALCSRAIAFGWSCILRPTVLILLGLAANCRCSFRLKILAWFGFLLFDASFVIYWRASLVVLNDSGSSLVSAWRLY